MHQPGCSGRSNLFLRLETGRWRLRRRRLVRSRGSGRGSEALLVGLFLLSSLYFFRRDLFEVSGYAPVVAQRIFDAGVVVAVELVLRLAHRGCTCAAPPHCWFRFLSDWIESLSRSDPSSVGSIPCRPGWIDAYRNANT